MRRFLVLQTVYLENDRASCEMEEPVMDFDTFGEATDWVNDQKDPTLYRVEDQFFDDGEEFLDEPQEETSFYDDDHLWFDRVEDRWEDEDDTVSGDGDCD